MANPNDPLPGLQDDITALLMGNPLTAAVPYSSIRKQTIESAADEAAAAWKVRQAGKVGLACTVLMPTLRVITPEVPGPQYQLGIVVRTYCDPKVNNITVAGLALTPERVAMANLTWLDGQIIEGVSELHGEDREDALAPNYDYPGLLVYDSRLMGMLPQDMAARTLPPSISDDDAGHVQLSCSDPAAVIYYTTDGSTPMPPSGVVLPDNIKVYAAPFAVVSGTRVRALAWNAAFLPSHVAAGTVTF